MLREHKIDKETLEEFGKEMDAKIAKTDQGLDDQKKVLKQIESRIMESINEAVKKVFKTHERLYSKKQRQQEAEEKANNSI